jgi:hypothetical protein
MSRSFIDLLFILLCSTIVLLSQSLQVGAVNAAPARVGGGGVSEVRADEVQLVVIDDASLLLVDEQAQQHAYTDPNAMLSAVQPDRCVLLAAAHASVSHHRVMAVWSHCRDAGIPVKLAAMPAEPEQPED